MWWHADVHYLWIQAKRINRIETDSRKAIDVDLKGAMGTSLRVTES